MAPNQRTESLSTLAARSQSSPATASRRTDTGRSRSPDGVTTSSEEWKPWCDGESDLPDEGNPPTSQNGGIVCTPSHPHTCTASRCQEATTRADGRHRLDPNDPLSHPGRPHASFWAASDPFPDLGGRRSAFRTFGRPVTDVTDERDHRRRLDRLWVTTSLHATWSRSGESNPGPFHYECVPCDIHTVSSDAVRGRSPSVSHVSSRGWCWVASPRDRLNRDQLSPNCPPGGQSSASDLRCASGVRSAYGLVDAVAVREAASVVNLRAASPHRQTRRLPWANMRGRVHNFREHWVEHRVATPAGELAFIVFPGPPPWLGCTRLDDVPIAPADARRILSQVGDEHAAMAHIGDGAVSVSPRQSCDVQQAGRVPPWAEATAKHDPLSRTSTPRQSSPRQDRDPSTPSHGTVPAPDSPGRSPWLQRSCPRTT